MNNRLDPLAIAADLDDLIAAEENLLPGQRLISLKDTGIFLPYTEYPKAEPLCMVGYTSDAAGTKAWMAAAQSWQASEQCQEQDEKFARTIERLGGRKSKKVKETKVKDKAMVPKSIILGG